MNPLAKLFRHPAVLRAKLPVLMLITLLQRSPVARLLSAAGEFFGEAPTGFVLKSSVATIAALGAVHTLAGATAYTLQTSGGGSPVSAQTGQAISPIGFTVTNTINIGSWMIVGPIPAGMSFTAVEGGNTVAGSGGLLDATTPGEDDGYGDITGGNARTTPVLSGTPTQSGNFTIQLTAYEFGGGTGLVSPTYNFVINVAAQAVAPAFSTNPSSQTVSAGANVTFSVAVSDPTASIQWTKNGNNIAGATGATLTLNNVQAADAASYVAVATNAAGSVTSAAATLTVNAAAVKPAFTTQPAGQTVPTGATAVFNSTATGATSYQWQLNGANVAGATSARLVVSNVTSANSGSYSVVASNAVGSTTSSAATLSATTTTNPGRLINLSVLTPAGAGSALLTVGLVSGGAGTSGQQNLLVRGVGPALVAFGLSTPFQPDPTLTIIPNSGAPSITNDNWGSTATNASAVTAADNATGAFPLSSTTSLDAATVTSLPAGGYSVQVSANGSAVGNVLAEVYDDTANYTLATPRLVNLSCLSAISGSGSVTAGFTVGGATSRSVLVRATGPALAALGVGGTMPDPQIVLVSSATGATLATNAAWGGDPQITAASTAVGAFAISNPNSKDSVVMVTLQPGGYTATASSASGSSGTALIEVYEVP